MAEKRVKPKSGTCPTIEERRPLKGAIALLEYVRTGNCHKAGKASGLSHQTVLAIARRNPEEFGLIKNTLASKCFSVAERALDSVTEADFANARLTEKMIAAGIGIQRGNELLDKEPPSGFDIAELRALVARLDERKRELMARTVDVTPTQEEAGGSQATDRRHVLARE
jgi:hypothetical protein